MHVNLGLEIRKQRCAIGMSQTFLAKAISKSPQLICDIEAGRKNPSIKTITAIAKIIGLSLDRIFLR